jgi:hypothetical protein
LESRILPLYTTVHTAESQILLLHLAAENHNSTLYIKMLIQVKTPSCIFRGEINYRHDSPLSHNALLIMQRGSESGSSLCPKINYHKNFISGALLSKVSEIYGRKLLQFRHFLFLTVSCSRESNLKFEHLSEVEIKFENNSGGKSGAQSGPFH